MTPKRVDHFGVEVAFTMRKDKKRAVVGTALRAFEYLEARALECSGAWDATLYSDGVLLGCRHVVLYAVVLFGALGVVEAIQRAYQVAGDAAELLLMRFMPYRNRAKPPNSPSPICSSSSTYASPSYSGSPLASRAHRRVAPLRPALVSAGKEYEASLSSRRKSHVK